MKQVLQNIKNRELSIADVPPPALQPKGLRVRTAASLISAGTEKMMLDLANKSIVGKAKARPDLVKQVINKARKEGLVNTFRSVQSKMERPMPLGYSAAGVVESVGSEVLGFKVGDRVAIAGAGYANHSEVNFVPANLAAHIPDAVSFGEAAYCTVASIALQGVRLAKPELGDYVAVVGLGLIGLIATQLLKANGCRVIGFDPDPSKVALAKKLGMDEGVGGVQDPVAAVNAFTRGRLVDHTIITAATKSNGPIETAGEITRRRGQVVVVGAVGMSIPRDIYYKKELEVKVSMSYGPGRYDPSYEEGGIDYPYDYVRWTEQRNMEAVLGLLADGKLDVDSLTTHRIPFDDAIKAYDMIQTGSEPYVGIVLEFDVDRKLSEVVRLRNRGKHESLNKVRIGFVGAGNYAALHLLPHLASSAHAELVGLVTATGLNAHQKADKFGFEYCTTELDNVLTDETIHSVFVATRHSSHAEYTIRALKSGKHVFVEKPLAAKESDLDRLIEAWTEANSANPTGLMVGLNRRFAPLVSKLKQAVSTGSAMQMTYRVNSGHIPTSSWLHEADEGGGMLIGEMCHFVDLMQFVCESKPIAVFGAAVAVGNSEIADTDNVILTIRFENGTVGTLVYNTIGNKSAPKERLEVFASGTTAFLNDFRSLEVFAPEGRRRYKSANQDKGQSEEMRQTVRAFATTGTSPIPFEEIVDGMRVVFAARRSIVEGRVVDLLEYGLRGQANVPAPLDRIVA